MRRPLTIPDPIRFMLLVDSLLTAHPQLDAIYRTSNLSLTRPRRDHRGHRAFTFRIDFRDQAFFRARVRAGTRYILQADINQFYPSIYTHSIPWSLHTKVTAKNNRSHALIGNLLDTRVRNGQDAQTMGLPIGPDSSFLLAEALLGSFDASLQATLGNVPGLRMLDEYEFAFASYTDAEEGIAIIQDHLAHFELSLNPRKTKIIEGPVPLDPAWLTELKAFALPETGVPPRRVVSAFIDRAFRLTSDNRDEAVLNWTLSRLLPLTFTAEQWRLVEPLVLQAASSEPGALPRCLRLLLNGRRAGLRINEDLLGRMLLIATSNAVRRGHGSEAAWGLWGHILFGIALDPELIDILVTFDEDIVALVALDARARGLIPRATAIPLWTLRVSDDGLRDGHWLLAYEATVKQWIRSVPNPVTNAVAFNNLSRRNVSFYRTGDPEAMTLSHAYAVPSWMVTNQHYLP